jgi:hypothetical protein
MSTELKHHDEMVAIIYRQSSHVYRVVKQKNKILEELNKPKIRWGMIDSIDQSWFSETGPIIILSNQQPAVKLPDNVKVFSMGNWWYGFYHIDKAPMERHIERDFCCFMNRIDVLRQNLFYEFYQNNLLDRGYVSMNLFFHHPNQPNSLEAGRDRFEVFHNGFLKSYDHLKDKVQDLVPFKNFQDPKNLVEVVIKTKFNIVLESYFERPDSLTFSEKTWRAVQLPRPWLLFHCTGSVQHLRNMGIDVFDDFVDHSYDTIDTADKAWPRLDHIINQTKQLVDMQITDSMFDVWEQKAIHNKQIIFDLYQGAMQHSLDTIEQAFEYALEQ